MLGTCPGRFGDSNNRLGSLLRVDDEGQEIGSHCRRRDIEVPRLGLLLQQPQGLPPERNNYVVGRIK